ncbi:MAG: hypothetical protein AMS18_13270 [Gemmatimonas sp. SG8_17]|nr:MAG: hypothetical protein AMS18_13270 [Gemmatimonas sp. SG8_17]
MAVHRFRPLIKRLLSPFRHDLAQQLIGFGNLFLLIACLGPRDRHEPVQVRMLQLQHLMATVANGARCARPGFAQEPLRYPQSQPLLADSRCSNKKGCLWEPAGGDRACQPVQRGFVAVYRPQTHRHKCSEALMIGVSSGVK